MAITVQETPDSLKLSQNVRDGYSEPKLTRKFIIQGAGNDPTQPSVANLSPLIGVGYFTQTTQTLSTAIANGASPSILAIAGSTVAMANGSHVVLGYNGASQTLTLTAAVSIGDTVIHVSTFTAAQAYPLYTPVTPGTSAPTNTLGLYCLSRELTPRPQADVTNNPIIDMVCQYGPPWRLPPNNIGVPLWSYDIQTENVHKQVAISQTDYPATASDAGDAIGVQSDGTIQGVDVLAPKSIIKASVKQNSFSGSYQDTLEALVGTTNNATFYGYATGRLLFLGCTAVQRGQGMFECEYVWLKQPASVTLSINTDAGGPQSVVKPAHTYLWLRSQQKQSGGVVTVVTKDVHVATVYDSGDYSGINFNQ
jgi:hypothetical protein